MKLNELLLMAKYGAASSAWRFRAARLPNGEYDPKANGVAGDLASAAAAHVSLVNAGERFAQREAEIAANRSMTPRSRCEALHAATKEATDQLEHVRSGDLVRVQRSAVESAKRTDGQISQARIDLRPAALELSYVINQIEHDLRKASEFGRSPGFRRSDGRWLGAVSPSIFDGWVAERRASRGIRVGDRGTRRVPIIGLAPIALLR